jgi:hypothetical protein
LSLRAGLIPFMMLFLLLGLSACGTSKSQSPVSSSEEMGETSAEEDTFSADGESPTSYTAKAGDTLRKIAGRPEIYGDPNLWPLLQEANADKVGYSMRVNKGVRLRIPRDLSDEQIEMAHEKARQAAAAAKMRSRPAKKPEATPESAPTSEVPVVTEEAAQTAEPVPPPKKGGMLLPVLFVLLLILAVLAVVLFYFMKKQNKDENQG